MHTGIGDIESQAEGDERSFHILGDSVTDYAVYLLNTEGYVINWNTGAQRIKQYTAEEVIGQHFSKFFTREDQQKGEPQRVLEIARKEGKCEAMGWRVRKDGTRFMANIVVEAIYDKERKIIGFIKITRDVTERRRAEQKIREGAMLKALINTAVDGIMMIDCHGTIQMANPACEKMFGYSHEELLGQDVKMLMPPMYHGDHDTYFRDRRETNMKKIIGIGRDVQGRHKDGSLFPMCLSIGEALQGGEPLYVAIMHDLTDRKRTEDQLVQAQKMETVGQLSGGIAHDFNNLLTVIIGNADLLSDNLRSRADLKQMCDTILNAGERGAELTQRLLAFSRRQTLQPAVIDCTKMVENMQSLLRRTLGEDIDLRVLMGENLNKAFADPSQLESAVLNLALNARDAMPMGGHLTISVSNISFDKSSEVDHPEIKPGNYVMIAVTDDGVGMPPEIRNRAFEPFFTTKEVGKGSGLGLSMVYGFAKQSNGHVTIYSEPRLGTTVRIYLPVAASTQATGTETAPVVDLKALRGTETVLVVEDDPFVRGHAVTSLESFGYKVITGANGHDALETLSKNPSIDVLFSDVVMPGGISGWDLAEQAQKQRPNIKILLTSGYPLETLTTRSRHNPNLSLLNKPYRKVDLGRRMREILDGPPPVNEMVPPVTYPNSQQTITSSAS